MLVGHLAAVIGPPLAFQARGPIGVSPSVATLVAPVESYGQALFLDRGYAFFAPDPGPSHLFQVAVKRTSGNTEQILIPDLGDQWPRLAYHRHFMLAEYYQDIYQPPGPPEGLAEAEPDAASEWARRRQRYEKVRQSFAQHIETNDPGCEVLGIRRVEHRIPRWEDYVREPIALDDDRLYVIQFDNPVSLDDPVDRTGGDGTLIAPARPAEAVPIPSGKPDADITDGAP